MPVEDLVQARGAVHRLKVLIEEGAGDEWQLEVIGRVVRGTSNETAPQSRAEVVTYLDGLYRRLNGCLPDW